MSVGQANRYLAIVHDAAESLQLLRANGRLRDLDSLSVIELLSEIERRAGVSFNPDEWPEDYSSTEALAAALLKANPTSEPSR